VKLVTNDKSKQAAQTLRPRAPWYSRNGFCGVRQKFKLQ